jgi:hypothetical protein
MATPQLVFEFQPDAGKVDIASPVVEHLLGVVDAVTD